MPIFPDHLRLYVVRPALEDLQMWSRAGENLVMGTAAQESRMRYLKQLGKGPAVSIFQIEPRTYMDMWQNWILLRPEVRNALYRIVAGGDAQKIPDIGHMYGNLKYAAAMCRIYYRRVPAPLPKHDDVRGMAAYWKKYYNTVHGKGTVEEFMRNYQLTLR